jgi:hypothetical protein
MDQQASYAVQAFAMAAAAGYQRFEFYQMVDQNPCTEPAVWGLTRDDGSRRPVTDALRTAVTQFAGYTRVRFVPMVRETQDWAPWPEDPTSLMPNWQVYQVAFDKPGNQRVTVLWNGDGAPLRARVRKTGSSATALDRMGRSAALQENQGWWVLDLPPALAHFPQDPDGYHFIGGEPVLLIEQGVDPSTPVVAPALGDPGSQPREFRLFPSPRDGQTVGSGQAAEFYVRVVGHEGYAESVSFSLDRWSTQRFPQPQDPSTLPLQVRMPTPTMPGQAATIRLETAGAERGIYYIDITASGGGQSSSFQLALVID